MEGRLMVGMEKGLTEEECEKALAALTELFEEAKNGDTPIMVERIVNDIDEIVRHVRFDGWQDTHAGETKFSFHTTKTESILLL